MHSTRHVLVVCSSKSWLFCLRLPLLGQQMLVEGFHLVWSAVYSKIKKKTYSSQFYRSMPDLKANVTLLELQKSAKNIGTTFDSLRQTKHTFKESPCETESSSATTLYSVLALHLLPLCWTPLQWNEPENETKSSMKKSTLPFHEGHKCK